MLSMAYKTMKGESNQRKLQVRMLGGFSILYDGKEIVLDGYRAICFTNPVDGVHTTDNGDGFISIKKSYFSEDISNYNKLNLVSLAELKAELKIDKEFEDLLLTDADCTPLFVPFFSF